MAQSKLQLVKNPSGKGVALAVNRKGVQVGVLPHSPKPSPQIRLIPATKVSYLVIFIISLTYYFSFPFFNFYTYLIHFLFFTVNKYL